MKLKVIVLFILTAVLFSGCSSEQDSLPTDEQCPLIFSPLLVNELETASQTRTTSTLPAGSTMQVLLFSFNSEASWPTDQYRYYRSKSLTVNSSGILEPTDGKTLMGRGGRNVLVLLNSFSGFADESNSSMNIAHGTDILFAYHEATFVAGTNNQVPSMDATHICPKIGMTITPSSENTKITSLSVGADGVAFIGMTHSPQPFSFYLSPNIVLSNIAQDDTVRYLPGNFTNNTAGNNLNGTRYVLPKSAGSLNMTFDLLANGTDPISLRATVPSIVFLSGYYYHFNVAIEDGLIVLTVWATVVDDLETGVSTSGDLIVGSWTLSEETSTSAGNSTSGSIQVGNWTLSPTWDTDAGNSTSGRLITQGWVENESDSSTGNSNSGTVSTGEWSSTEESTSSGTSTSGTVTTDEWNTSTGGTTSGTSTAGGISTGNWNSTQSSSSFGN
jgi:hypothetical protein